MLQFHTETLSAKLSIHEDRHGTVLGGGGGEHRTHTNCKNTERNQCNDAVYLNLCAFLKTNVSADSLKKLRKISISKKLQSKTQISYMANRMTYRKLLKPVL
jgi:uncharacterized Fe-S cluster-containing protein